MVAPANFEWSFLAVGGANQDEAFFVAENDESVENYIQDCALWHLRDGWQKLPISIFAVDLCIVDTPARTVLVAAGNGTIIRVAQDGVVTEEQIDSSEDGPHSKGFIRSVSIIGGRAYAVGVARVAYRCDGPGNWTRIDHGVRVDRLDDPSVVWNTIAGFSESDIYAVGDNGEIWHGDGQQWIRCASPTSDRLQQVVCAGDGFVYAVGQQGLILKGRDDSWSVIEQTATSEGFHGATWFLGKLYCASANGLWVLNGSVLTQVDIGNHEVTRSACFSRLDSTDDAIWSAGAKMLLSSKDGVTWSELTYI